MKLKSLIVTIAILAALSAIVFFVNRPEAPTSADARIGKPLVDSSTVEKAAKFKMSDQGKTIILTKQKDGSWIDSSYHDLPANFQKLSEIVTLLSGANVQRLVTTNPEKISRLEFKDTQVAFLDNADKPLWSLTLGKNFESGGRFVRFGDEPKAYLANLSLYPDTDPKNWADSSLLTLKPEDIAKVELTFPGGAPVIVKRAKKEDPFAAENAPAGEKLKVEKITGLLSSITSLKFSDTSELQDEKAVAAKNNARAIKLTTFDGKTYTIALGRKPEQKIVKTPTPGADGKSGPAALGKVADLMKKPETEKAPTEGGEAAAKDNPAKLVEPTVETIPAGPVYAFITSSDASAPVNGLMQKLAYQVDDYVLTNVPQKSAELFEPSTPAAAAKPSDSGSKPEDTPKP